MNCYLSNRATWALRIFELVTEGKNWSKNNFCNGLSGESPSGAHLRNSMPVEIRNDE